jgi:hypothetical protein
MRLLKVMDPTKLMVIGSNRTKQMMRQMKIKEMGLRLQLRVMMIKV